MTGRLVHVRLAQSLRMYWGGAATFDVEAATLADALARLDALLPGVRARVLDDQGAVRPHVLVFVNEDGVKHRPPRDVPLAPGDTVHILPAVSGGSCHGH